MQFVSIVLKSNDSSEVTKAFLKPHKDTGGNNGTHDSYRRLVKFATINATPILA